MKLAIVINTAAFNRVDDCEEEVTKEFWVNAFAVRNLAEICADLDCVLVHISTKRTLDDAGIWAVSYDGARGHRRFTATWLQKVLRIGKLEEGQM